MQVFTIHPIIQSTNIYEYLHVPGIVLDNGCTLVNKMDVVSALLKLID
jgi:hypothetical protein